MFSSTISGLVPNTTYYVRAYAFSYSGTASYGEQFSFTTTASRASTTDIGGNTYQLVTICNQTWIQTNLNVTKYRNGDIIPQVTDATQWIGLTTGAWCYLNNDPANAVLGKLYNWYAVNDPRGLAPLGYHIPTDAEWTTLTTCLGGYSIAGSAMKETGNNYWYGDYPTGTNSSGFTALPGGYRSDRGAFYNDGMSGCWWSSSEPLVGVYAYDLYLNNNNGSSFRNFDSETNGLSVRCIKD